MMRILVTGASGLLGLNFALGVDGKTHTVIGVANTAPHIRVNFRYLQAELTETGIIEKLLDEEKPDLLLHTAALANMEACEVNPQLAADVNAVLPGRIAYAAGQRDIQMIHISTDAVFDGTKGNYRETDAPNPLSVYARTKLAGEEAVTNANPQALVARVNFYGWSMSGTRSLAEFFVNHLAAGKTVKGFTDVLFCPLMVLELADLLLEAAEKKLHGLYHLVGAQAMSKFDFGIAIAQTFGFDPDLVKPASVSDGGLTAARSPNLSLNTAKITTALGHALPNFESGLARFYEQYRSGFPQYIQALAQPAV
jgi:dTDP-4-dehydrorhamnose reductase